MAVIAFDASKSYVCHLDDGVEHHILLKKVGYTGTEIDQFFRIIFDKEGADWTFICPPDYKNIPYKAKRIKQFYKDGIRAISEFLADFGYICDIKIPKRYSVPVKSSGELRPNNLRAKILPRVLTTPMDKISNPNHSNGAV